MLQIETRWHWYTWEPKHVTSFIPQFEEIILYTIWGCVKTILRELETCLTETCLTESSLHTLRYPN